MDYRALGELVFMALMGLSALGIVFIVGFHFVLRPFLENILLDRTRHGALDARVERRLEAVEGRVVELEAEVDRVSAAQDFDRQLGK